MAHYVADLITNCETENEKSKEAAQRDCFDAILALWRHRSELPTGNRPFEDLEPIVRAVASLDPDDDTPRYYRQARLAKRANEEETETETWLNLVDGLDYSAKILIGYCLSKAANTAIDKSKEWVKLAEAAAVDEGPSEIVIRFVAPGDDLSKGTDQNAELREQLEGRLKRLEFFLKLAGALTDDLKTQLKEIPVSIVEVGEAKDE